MKAGPKLHTVALAEVPAQPWRNGGGSTRELLAWPAVPRAAPDAWRVRVSVARIAHSGPFSAFPGVQRWFTVLAGAGVQLRWASRSVNLAPGDAPLGFDGAEPPGCTLSGGPTDDLNLMLRGPGALQPARMTAPWACPGAAWRGLYTRHALQLRTGSGVQALAADTLLWSDTDDSLWTIEASTEPLQAWWLHLEAGQ
jgi:environmental stress-induced protein Ves